MEWAFTYNEKMELLEVEVKGEMTLEELNAMAKENLEEVKRRNCFKCLLNYQNASNNLSIVDTYNRPKDISKIGVGRMYRIAILVNKQEQTKYKFLENVYKNNGYELRVCVDRPAAMEFLTKD